MRTNSLAQASLFSSYKINGLRDRDIKPLNMSAASSYSSGMTRFCARAGIVPNLILAIILIAAQSVVSAHDINHDAGNAQNQVCTTCVAAGQLGTACVDSVTTFEVTAFDSVMHTSIQGEFNATHALIARQRGPPSQL
jgi:hypothetical protein